MINVYIPAKTFSQEINENKSNYEPFIKNTMQNPHDKFFKETFGNIALEKDFLTNYLPTEILQATNLDTLQIQKDTFIDENLEESYSDLLFKAEIQGKDGYFYFLFEHKSYPERKTALQLLKYMVEIWSSKSLISKEDELPVIIPLVIYQGKARWTGPTQFGDLVT